MSPSHIFARLGCLFLGYCHKVSPLMFYLQPVEGAEFHGDGIFTAATNLTVKIGSA